MENGKKSNDNKSNNNNRGIMIYFVIRKFKIKDSGYQPEYRVEKHTDNLDEANKFLSALTLLEDSRHITWHIVQHDFNAPLILTKEVA
jgi:hypothetical protein